MQKHVPKVSFGHAALSESRCIHAGYEMMYMLQIFPAIGGGGGGTSRHVLPDKPWQLPHQLIEL